MALPVAVVTGANSGLGLALSVKLARSHLVLAGMRSKSKAEALLAAASAAEVSQNIQVLELDVNSDESVRDNLGAALKETGRADVLVNNAGYSVFGSVEMMSMEAMKAQFETNLFGVIRCQKEVLPLMRQQKAGKIINVSSVGGVWGQPFNDIYCASKFALEGLCESQAALFRTFGIKSTLVEPGPIKSAFIANAQQPDKSAVPADYVPALQSTMAAYQKSAGGGQTPEEVADIIIEQAINADPPLRIQTYAPLKPVFEQQLVDLSGETGVDVAAKRFLSGL